MKTTTSLAAILLFSLFSIGARATSLPSVIGTYSYPHKIAFLSYADQAACEGDQGKWEDDVCVMDASDDVTVTAAAKLGAAGPFVLAISTVTNNAHMCDFSQPARAVGANVLVASEKNAEGVCTVTATFASDRTSVSIKTKGTCDDDCGMNARLDIGRAERK